MNELYWIMVLDYVYYVSCIVMIVGGLIAVGTWIVSFILRCNT